ncbi:sulfite exporter TauE/SafE family protein [Paracrocinitomix mangrovi]|uniref:sulfite exporter TauE/SafE family protein n=1 Tax=Paracrocinitomix mangrovi TaxID=2862509 RepID=UPI001C8D9EF9|nr:sulfite exporter TauE/SafE family protein [Paracrocinitomix mangrovi]UKN01681.1 sulfite exporter TauE/SafE family protein [Paracrocinitomix mangrovi]
MDIVVLIIVAFGASWLTFFCGFGLGTLLTPVFYFIFNDMVLAIAGTAVVHFLNNIFKFLLMNKSINWKIALPFGLAAIPAAFLGAKLIDVFQNEILLTYQLANKTFEIQLFNLVFGIILIGFALIEIIPKWSLAFSKQSLIIGGLISGFFGGLSGHQGALRTAFLIRYQLEKEVFIATGIVVALAVDISRTTTYFYDYGFEAVQQGWQMILFALGAALAGAITGKLFLKKIKMQFLTNAVSIAMIVFGIALALGFLNK